MTPVELSSVKILYSKGMVETGEEIRWNKILTGLASPHRPSLPSPSVAVCNASQGVELMTDVATRCL